MKYKVNIPGYHGLDDWDDTDGYDAESAAQEAGQSYNEEGDYSLMNGDGVFIRVQEVDSEDKAVGDVQVYYVTAEASIDYSSSEVTSQKCIACGAELITKIKTGKFIYLDEYCDIDCYKKHRTKREEQWKKLV